MSKKKKLKNEAIELSFNTATGEPRTFILLPGDQANLTITTNLTSNGEDSGYILSRGTITHMGKYKPLEEDFED